MNFFKKVFNKTFKENLEIKAQEVNLSLDDLFVHNFIKKGGKFLYCLEKEESILHLKSILSENNWKNILVTNPDLLSFLDQKEIAVDFDFKKSTPFFTTCEHLIADKGDVLFSSNQLRSKKLSEFSENFIVFATTSQLVKNTGQGLTGIKTNAKHAIPTNISAVKNYTLNKTEENLLNHGISNSKNLYLLLLEDL
ncbi:hypothetical protein PI23P_07275 [Polaribacter irgensii 23-P]|uniref:LUD domain-containing protein n=1 Tax=Polaribacter irgensii 23-P TaxID=313594 RepID=A4BZ14_9FLAO|nr:hypothetical protein [Polaribacter irgensii]EAR12407.1 hypothetical protein PI23P_07275 [Polaribacter irgensii 23-P]